MYVNAAKYSAKSELKVDVEQGDLLYHLMMS
jgi:hypothetical protein